MNEKQNSETVRGGTVLVKDNALLPLSLQNIQSESYVRGWKLFRDLHSDAMDRRIQQEGWTFFCLAGPIQSDAFGFHRASAVRRAITRILANPGSKAFNSLEITRIEPKWFLGIPYLSVSAQSRHIQSDGVLYSEKTGASAQELLAANPGRLLGGTVVVETGVAVS